MKQKRKVRKKRIVIIILSVLLCAALVMIGLMIYGKAQMAKVPGLTFREALEYTAKGKKNAVITVGIIKDGKASWTVYGENGQELPEQLQITFLDWYNCLLDKKPNARLLYGQVLG